MALHFERFEMLANGFYGHLTAAKIQRSKDHVPVLLPTVCGECYEILSDYSEAKWRARYGDAFIKWMPIHEAIKIHGKF